MEKPSSLDICYVTVTAHLWQYATVRMILIFRTELEKQYEYTNYKMKWVLGLFVFWTSSFESLNFEGEKKTHDTNDCNSSSCRQQKIHCMTKHLVFLMRIKTYLIKSPTGGRIGKISIPITKRDTEHFCKNNNEKFISYFNMDEIIVI